MKQIHNIAGLFIAGVFCMNAQAGILVRSSAADFSNGYGKPDWTTFSALLDAASGTNVQLVADLEESTRVSSAHSLWIDVGGSAGVLSATETANIQNFMATGKRVVMIGEMISWSGWNYQLANVAGATVSGSKMTNGSASTVLTHELTRGVTTINIGTGGTLRNGSSLFSQQVAALFKPDGNVLLLLDSDMFNNSFINDADNLVFAQNVAAWISKTANGTPLIWMNQHNLSTDTTDPDLDNFSSWQEYICGTNPTNDQSLFRVGCTNGSLVWEAVTNRLYSVEVSTNLTNGFTQVASGAATSSFMLPLTNDASFFRVQVQLNE